MSSNWQWSTLGEVCEVRNGATPDTNIPHYWDGPHAWVTPAEMGGLDSPFVSKTRRTLTDQGLAACSASLAPEKSVILSSRAPIGHLIINEVPMATNQGCKTLVPSRSLNFKFLYYFLKANVPLLDSLGTGATFRELSAGKLKEVTIPVPPLAEQQRIVAKLDEVDADLRTLSERLDTELLQSAQVRLSAMNELLDQNRGKKVKLGDILSLEYGKPLDPSRRDSSAAVPVYGANGVKTFTSRALYEEPTIVVGRKGSAGELALTDGPCWPLDVTYYVVHDRAVTDLVFLHTLLKKCDLPRLAKGVKPGINRNEVYELECLLPSLAEQQQIVARLGEVDSVCAEVSENIERRKAKAGELRQSVLAAAFRGDL